MIGFHGNRDTNGLYPPGCGERHRYEVLLCLLSVSGLVYIGDVWV